MKTRSRSMALSAALTLTALGIAQSGHAQTLYAADATTGNIYAYATNGSRTTFATGLADPTGMAFDSSGNLFVGVTDGLSNAILKFAPGGGTPTVFASGLLTINGLAFDSSGNLYAATLTNIVKITPGGSVSNFVTGLNTAYGLAVDSSNNVYASQALPAVGTITKYSPSGSPSGFASGLDTPDSIGINGGYLYEDDNLSGQVLKFNLTNGNKSTFASGLVGPTGMAFDSNGDVFISDITPATVIPLASASTKILEFTPGGSESTFATGLTLAEQLAFQPAGVPEASTLFDVLGGLALGGTGLLVRRRRK